MRIRQVMMTRLYNVARGLLRHLRKGASDMDVILHLGAHHCGLQPFQTYLEDNSDALQRRGIALWSRERVRGGLFTGLLRAPESVTPAEERRAARANGLIRVELSRAERAGLDGVIVSAPEVMGPAAPGALYPLLQDRLMRLRNGLGGQCRRVGLSICGFEDFWRARMARTILRGGVVPDRAALERIVSQPRRWRHVVTDIKNAFPMAQIVVWPQERFAMQLGTQADVLSGQSLGLSSGWMQDPRAGQRSLEQHGVRLNADGRWQPFDAAQRALLRGQYENDINWLRAGAAGMARFVETLDRDRTSSEVGINPRPLEPKRGQWNDTERQMV